MKFYKSIFAGILCFSAVSAAFGFNCPSVSSVHSANLVKAIGPDEGSNLYTVVTNNYALSGWTLGVQNVSASSSSEALANAKNDLGKATKPTSISKLGYNFCVYYGDPGSANMSILAVQAPAPATKSLF